MPCGCSAARRIQRPCRPGKEELRTVDYMVNVNRCYLVHVSYMKGLFRALVDGKCVLEYGLDDVRSAYGRYGFYVQASTGLYWETYEPQTLEEIVARQRRTILLI